MKKIQKFFSHVFEKNSHHSLWIASSLGLAVIFIFSLFYSFNAGFQVSVDGLLWGKRQSPDQEKPITTIVVATQQGTQQNIPLFHLPVTVVYNTDSSEQKARMDQFLGNLADPQRALTSSELQVTWLDYKTPAAQDLMKKSGIHYLPQIFIDPSIEQHPQFKAMGQYLNKKDGIYYIRIASLQTLSSPPVTDGHLSGTDPSTAKTVLQVYESYTSDQSKAMDETLKRLRAEKPDGLSVIYKHFEPSDIFNLIAQGTECANDQNKFLEMREQIFSGQPEMLKQMEKLLTQNPADPTKVEAYLQKLLQGYAQKIKLNTKNFQDCMKSNTHQKVIQMQTLDALDYGVSTLPSLFINNDLKTGPLSYDEIIKSLEITK